MNEVDRQVDLLLTQNPASAAGSCDPQAADQLALEIGADGTRQTQAFIIAEDRRLEGVPGQHEPRSRRVQIGAAFGVGQLVQAPSLHLSATLQKMR